MPPKVSVITPLYQGEEHIEQCLKSVIDQGRDDVEHLLIDNNSTDHGPEIVRAYAETHPHIRLLHNPVQGAGPSRNLGIHAAEGRYIAFLDSDDWWHSEKLDQQISAMEEHSAVFSWTSYDVVDQTGRRIRTQSAPKVMTVRRHLLKTGTIGCLTVVYDTEALGRRYMNDLGLRQDFCLWLHILRSCEEENLRTIGLKMPLACYRSHRNGISANKWAAAKMQWRACRTHADLSFPLAVVCFLSYTLNGIIDRVRR